MAARKKTARKKTPRKKTPAKKAPAKKAPAQKTPAKQQSRSFAEVGRERARARKQARQSAQQVANMGPQIPEKVATRRRRVAKVQETGREAVRIAAGGEAKTDLGKLAQQAERIAKENAVQAQLLGLPQAQRTSVGGRVTGPRAGSSRKKRRSAKITPRGRA
jgi:hypothetical protein